MTESKEELESLLLNIKKKKKKKIVTSSPIISWEIDGETIQTVKDFFFFWAPKSLRTVTAAMKLKDAYSLEEKIWKT